MGSNQHDEDWSAPYFGDVPDDHILG